MTVCGNIKRPINKGVNTIWSLLTEESRPTRVPFSTDYDEVVAEYQNNSIDNKEVAIMISVLI